jgi:hypothetical protein
VLHCYCTKCERLSKACYVNRIFSKVGIYVFFIG